LEYAFFPGVGLYPDQHLPFFLLLTPLFLGFVFGFFTLGILKKQNTVLK